MLRFLMEANHKTTNRKMALSVGEAVTVDSRIPSMVPASVFERRSIFSFAVHPCGRPLEALLKDPAKGTSGRAETLLTGC